MLRSCNEIRGYRIEARDDDIGKVSDLLFDDQRWTTRYLVTDTGRWLPGRKVLVSPISVIDIDWSTRNVRVSLSRKEIEEGPALEENAPVSAQYEREYFDHLGYAYYWGGPGLWGAEAYPAALLTPRERVDTDGDHHLRSMREVRGYGVRASDGEIGSIDDFIVDDASWALRYLVVDLGGWLPGRRVLVSPVWASDVSWPERQIQLDLSRAQLENSPTFDPKAPINREYEIHLYDYYGRPRYWER